jgi:hypothetical protein
MALRSEVPSAIQFANIAPKWAATARSTNGASVFLSPYLTSTTAETVLRNLKVKARIYTLFKAENFASGASSLGTLRKLVVDGHLLFHLEGLHAKVALFDDVGSIGSQNLTRGGTTRLEASVVLTDPVAIQHMKTRVTEWIEEASPISLDMIEDMERELRPLRKQYVKAQRLAQELDGLIEERELLRVATKAQARVKVRRRRVRAFVRSIQSTNQSSDVVYGEIQSVNTNAGWSTTHSLIALYRGNLLRWRLANEEVGLSTTKRYLCVIPTSGKLGWARVMKTRITFVGAGVLNAGFITIGESRYRVSMQADWSNDGARGRNLEVTLAFGAWDVPICSVSMWVSVSDVEILEIESIAREGYEKEAVVAKNLIAKEGAEFARQCLHLVLAPFTYTRNLYGVQATEFFGDFGQRYRIRLAQMRDHEFLVAEPV